MKDWFLNRIQYLKWPMYNNVISLVFLIASVFTTQNDNDVQCLRKRTDIQIKKILPTRRDRSFDTNFGKHNRFCRSAAADIRRRRQYGVLFVFFFFCSLSNWISFATPRRDRVLSPPGPHIWFSFTDFDDRGRRNNNIINRPSAFSVAHFRSIAGHAAYHSRARHIFNSRKRSTVIISPIWRWNQPPPPLMSNHWEAYSENSTVCLIARTPGGDCVYGVEGCVRSRNCAKR